MRPADQEPRGGGIFLALGPILGAIIGVMTGQATIGFLVGLAVAIVLATGLWLADRRPQDRT